MQDYTKISNPLNKQMRMHEFSFKFSNGIHVREEINLAARAKCQSIYALLQAVCFYS
jgi:hypothetical protein